MSEPEQHFVVTMDGQRIPLKGQWRPILCLDFDGVIHGYQSGWQSAAVIPDPPVPGAIEFILQALAAFSVNVFSSRSHQPGGIEAMRAYLKIEFAKHFARKQGRPDDDTGPMPRSAWAQAEEALAGIAFPEHKPSASVSIDDRAITFTGAWPSIEALQAFKPWNKP